MIFSTKTVEDRVRFGKSNPSAPLPGVLLNYSPPVQQSPKKYPVPEVIPSGSAGYISGGTRCKKKKRLFLISTGLCTAFLLLVMANLAHAQQPNINGRIVDAQEDGLPGASVQLVGTNRGVHADANGKFALNVAKFPVILKISMIGFRTTEVQVTKPANNLKIVVEAVDALDEIVVIGYGEASRAKLTSSISKVQGVTLSQQPIQNPVMGLQGRVAGLYMTAPSGNLGANPTVVIRGNSTILSSSNPLYIVDGVPMPSTGINSSAIGGATGVQSPFINLNSADIESVEVLKDADATAIYGTRGANGVILITTKKGTKGTTRVGFDMYSGFQKARNKINYLTTGEYLQLRRDAFAADGVAPTAANAPDLFVWDQNGYTDFQKLLFGETAPVTDAQANVQGGNENTTYLFAVGFRNENGVIMNTNNQKKYTTRLNVTHKGFNGRMNINSGINYTVLNTDAIGTSGISAFTSALAPNLPLTDSETGLPYFFSTQTWGSSPLSYTHSGVDLKNYQFIGSASLAYSLLDNLKIKVDGSFTRLDYNGNEKYRNAYLNPFATYNYKNFAQIGTNYQHTYNLEPQLNYNVKIGKGKLTALLGATWQNTVAGGQLVYAYDFPSELLMDNLGSASRIGTYSTTYNEYKFNSVFGRLTYDFADKYVLNATYRRDGSSRFSPENRFGNFWAIGGAWLISNEPFLKDNATAISFAKLRASYGLTGNDAISNYQYMETFAATTYPYNGVGGMYANRLGNTAFKWETNNKFEVALELNLFNNRITTTTAFFNNQGSNQLVNYPVSTQTGWTSYVANLNGALIRNRGLEFEFTTHTIKTSDFNWKSSFNITTYKNTLVSFPGLSSSGYSNTYEIGKSINTFRRYEFDRIDPQTGIPYVVDQNGDGAISAIGDYKSFGSSDPSYYGGLGNTFTYKGLSLDVFFQYTRRPYANSLLWNYYLPVGSLYNVPRYIAENAWRSPENPGTLPRLSQATSGDFYRQYVNQYGYSNALLEDASFIRLKNLMLSYSVANQTSRRLGLHHIKVYILGQNLLTFTKYKGLDPETGNATTPLLKTYTLGFTISI